MVGWAPCIDQLRLLRRLYKSCTCFESLPELAHRIFDFQIADLDVAVRAPIAETNYRGPSLLPPRRQKRALGTLSHDYPEKTNEREKDGKIKTAMTVDCDVHHGNGTAAIFGIQSAEPTPRPERLPYMRESPARDVFTISLHQENNYPAWKPQSSIDVGLPDSIGDDEYLDCLEKALMSGLQRFQPNLICYLAGSDKWDLLGGLALTIEGLKRRDEFVFRTAKAHGIPVLALPAGGYASDGP